MAPNALHGFVCTQCGQCCRVPGYVQLSHEDIERLAVFLCLRVEVFTKKYTRLLPDRSGLALLEQADGSCVHLDAAGRCGIEAVKPKQCRAFPYQWRYADMSTICEGWGQ